VTRTVNSTPQSVRTGQAAVALSKEQLRSAFVPSIKIQPLRQMSLRSLSQWKSRVTAISSTQSSHAESRTSMKPGGQHQLNRFTKLERRARC
jgi:hypothetical protein